MPALFTPAPPALEWHPIDLGDGQTFEVGIRKPTWRDNLNDYSRLVGSGDHETRTAQVEGRIRSAVADWRGVNDEAGNPVPFSLENLAAMAGMYPSVFVDCLTLSNRAFNARPASAQKKEPSSDS